MTKIKAILALLAALWLSPATAGPNIIYILTDDLTPEIVKNHLPKTNAELTAKGWTSRNSIVSLASCCPSRATILSGRYAHNTGITANSGPDGGWATFNANGGYASTIGTWMQAAGYRTAYYGKELNGRPIDAPPAPGWTSWAVGPTPEIYNMFNYRLREVDTELGIDRIANYGTSNAHYLTHTLDTKARWFIRTSAAANRPFFLFVAPTAPHQPWTPSALYAGSKAGLTAPRTPAYNEAAATMALKPNWIKNLPPLAAWQMQQNDTRYRLRVESMLSVDDMVASLIREATLAGVIDNTCFAYHSDNAYHLGEHRLVFDKLTPYETDIRVPLIVRCPGAGHGTATNLLTANVDIAPTIAGLAGVPVPTHVDGRDLSPLIYGTVPAVWRNAVLLEAYTGPEINMPSFVGLRTRTHWAVFYETGEAEVYDLVADPHQLLNIASAMTQGWLDAMKGWADDLAACSGAACRTIEERVQPTPEFRKSPIKRTAPRKQ